MATETTGLRAITVRQPYAQLLALGHKGYETRPYQPRIVGVGDRIAIHAGARVAQIAAGGTLDWIDNALIGKSEPLGAIVATATIVGVYPTTGVGAPSVSDWERAVGDWSPRRWAWSLDVERLAEPIPCRGALGLWLVPGNIAARVASARGTEA